MTDVDELVAWLRAQLDADEQAAEVIRCGGFAPPTWYHRPHRVGKRWMEIRQKDRENIEPPGAEADLGGEPIALVPAGRNEHEHIARHDPAHVLGLVAAHRRILDGYATAKAEYERVIRATDAEPSRYQGMRFAASAWAQAMRLTVILLAAGYTDRPGYRQEWAP